MPQTAASLDAGGSAALYATPEKDGAPAMRLQSLAPPGPPGRRALEESATAADWDGNGDMLAVGYGSGGGDGGGVFVWTKVTVETE